MSTIPPPTPDQQPEYLDSTGGSPVAESTAARGRSRRGLLVAGGVVGLALVGAGAWAAVSFFATGAQPAQALPAGTLGYVAVDLDPSGGQKIEALRTLNKFPAFEEELGIDTDDDLRRAIFEELQRGLGCSDLDYAEDVEPWLGDRAAFAAVDTGGDTPHPVFVLQVTDAGRAEDGLRALADCAGEGLGSSVDGDWAVLAETEAIAEDVTGAAADGSLADDEDFQRWTEEAGDSGIVTMYAGPALGDFVADNADEVFGLGAGLNPLDPGMSSECVASDSAPDGTVTEVPCSDVDMGMDLGALDGGLDDGGVVGQEVPEELEAQLREFGGAAGVLRFDDGAFELEIAADAALAGNSLLAADGGAATLATLPSDTAAAIGLGFTEGWFGDLLEYYAPYLGGGEDLDGLVAELEAQTGLTVPEDVETVFGDSAALAIGTDFDLEEFFLSMEGSGVPVALKVDGDAEEIEAVLDKLRAQGMSPDEAGLLGSSVDGDTVVIGPDEEFRDSVLADGDLGDNEVFRDVVQDADDAAMVVFVNVDEIQQAFADLAGPGDDEVLDNVEPISGFGVSSWVDGDVARSVARLTTD